MSPSGLVFYYDTFNEKSYKGQPTTNVASNPLDLFAWCTSGANSATLSRDTSTLPSPIGGVPMKMTTTGNDAYTNTYSSSPWNLNAASQGQVWTMSVWAKANRNLTCELFLFEANSSPSYYINFSTVGISVTTEWQRFTLSRTNTEAATAYIQVRLDGPNSYTAGDIVWWDGLQVEQKPHATQFTAGTRSNTNGLVDLTGTTTPNLTNTKFDSNATIDFPINASANSYITTNTNCGLTGDQTLTAWIKPTYGTASPHRTVICTDASYQYGIKLMNYKNYARWGLWVGWGSSNYEALTTTDINNNQWKMITGTWKQSTGIVTLYLNGAYVTQFSTGNTSAISLNTGNIWVGMGYEIDFGNGQSYEGKIDSAAIYNRTLTADEVLQNYNSVKSRFGL